jgi:hypothetical protein
MKEEEVPKFLEDPFLSELAASVLSVVMIRIVL